MTSILRNFTLLVAFLGLAACAATPGHVYQERPVDEINNEHGLALRGYDPVAYFNEHKPVVGDATINSTWKGATYRFASAENRDAFLADPERYAPRFGGYCAYAVSRGTTANGDPHQWAIVNDRLFLNNNPLAMTLWNEDRRGNIHAGAENWPLIAKQPLAAGERAEKNDSPAAQRDLAAGSSTQE